MPDGSIETQADFEQSLHEDGILELLMGSAPGEDASGPTEPPVDTGSADRPRNEKGQFVSSKEEPDDKPEVVSEEVADKPEVDTEPAEDDGDIVIELDDDLTSILERYDGDVTKALRALNEKESFTGRQANEIGQLRADLAAMRQMLEQQPPQQHWGPYQNDINEDPKAVVFEALERGDQRTMAQAVQAWGQDEPFEAAAFLFSLSQNQPAPEEPTLAPATGPSIEQAMAEVVARHPDVEQYTEKIGEVAKEFPTLRNFMAQGTPAQQAQAFEELLVIAKTRSGDTSSAMKRVILKTQEEVRKEKAEAAVVSGQTQSAATAGDSPLEQFYSWFDEATGQSKVGDWIDRSNQ